jgi:hypothetical protein
MLTLDGARLQVFLELRRRHGWLRGPQELVIHEHTIERPWGWVFFYNARGFLDGDMRYALGGNAPIIVNRYDGTFRDTGTAAPVEYYIAEYEAELERQSGAWELVILEPRDSPLHVISRMRKALGLSVAEVGALRKRLPCLVQVGARIDLEPVLARLIDAGVSSELRKSARSE